MAKPWIMFNNIIDTADSVTVTSADTDYPITNINDWRYSVPWKATSAVEQTIDIDMGVGNTAPVDTIVWAGHNFGDVTSAMSKIEILSSPDVSAWTRAALVDVIDLGNGIGYTTFTEVDTRAFRVKGDRAGPPNNWTVAMSCGILAIGKRLDFTEGVQVSLDPYRVESVIDGRRQGLGSPLGQNIRFNQRRFNIFYEDTPFVAADFFAPASGLGWDTDFVPHAIEQGKPFFFAWDTGEEATDVTLCRVRAPQVTSPFNGSYKHRGLQCTFEAYGEIL